MKQITAAQLDRSWHRSRATKRKSFLSLLSLVLFGLFVLHVSCAVLAAAAAETQATSKRPNILLIVVDDLGYADLGCQGGKDIPTPNIDSLAQKGVRCKNGYVTCPVCSPTRAGLLTGRYQQRFGHEFNPGPPAEAGDEFGLPLTEITLAERLQAAGYVTGMVGKWHLGLKEKFNPLRRGFTEYFGFLHGSHSYLDAHADGRNPILRGFEKVDEKEYLTEAFTREALAFIARHQKEPFFLYLPYNAVHAPLQAPQQYLDRFPKIKEDKRRTFAAMLSALDDSVGAVLNKLREINLEKSTLIFFISDNGGPTRITTSRNAPLSGFKGEVLEGGIRIPFLAQWPDHLPAGKIYESPVSSLDIFPTVLAAAGGPLPADRVIDGVNLLPFLSGANKSAPHDFLFWRFGAQSAVRKGNWKLVKRDSQPTQLFDLSTDVGEDRNLAVEKPEVTAELDAALKQWGSQLAKPLWGGRR